MRAAALGLIVLGFFFACAAPRAPEQVLSDPEATSGRWSAALRALPPTEASHRLCRDIVFQPGHTGEQRALAAAWLVDHGDTELRADLAGRISTMGSWDTLDALFDFAARRGWREYLGPAAEHYGKAMTGYDEAERPERVWLTALAPQQSVEASLWDVLTDTHGSYDTRHRLGAWSALNRLLPPEVLRERLEHAPPTTWTDAVRWAYDTLGVWPRTGEGLHRVSQLPRGHEGEPGKLPGEIPGGMRVYHWAIRDEAWPGETWDDRLIGALRDAMAQPQVVAAWFAQADADRADPSTEHGGLLMRIDGAWRAVSYPPFFAVHDRAYVPSPALVDDLIRAVAHYHFHAQPEDGTDRRGPSTGDLRTAQRLEMSCLVLAMIDADTLAVTWYSDASQRELGEVRRPRQGVSPVELAR